MKLYRYRGIEVAYTEIENHTFRFSDRKSLNDPIEGYVKLYWEGDSIAWEGLFKNYIHSLYVKLIDILLVGGKTSIASSVLLNVDDDNHQLVNALLSIEKAFVESKEVKRIIAFYSKNKIKCSKKELKYLLNCFQKMAFNICADDLISRKILPPETKGKEFSEDSPSMEEVCVGLCALSIKDRWKVLETIGVAWEELTDQMLWKAYSGVDVLRKEWLMVRFQFPKLYVEDLEELIYPENFVVCFSKTSRNSSMWGNYADDHKGICMIFETEEKRNKHYLSINTPYSYSTNGTEYMYKDTEVRPIVYGRHPDHINFFTNMGRVTEKQLARFLINRQQEKSICWNEYFGTREEQWRSIYWERCENRFLKKMDDWKHEEEYRLLLPDCFSVLSNPESRTLQYDFTQLKGVIFGMKVSNDDKYKMIELIKKECEKIKRKDFLFYQSDYSDKTACMEVRKMYI